MKLSKRINACLEHKGFLPTIHAVQYDTGLRIIISIKDFSIPEGTTAKAFFKKPSGKFVYQDASISGNDITIDVENQALTEYGYVYYQVRLINGNDIITTYTGKIDAEKSLADSSATSSETIVPAFDSAVQKAVTEIESARDSAIQYIGNGLDSSLTQSGKAADAGATGAAIDELKGDLEELCEESRNIWNEKTESGYVNPSDGVLKPSEDYIRSVDFTEVVPNTKYYSTNPYASGIVFVFFKADETYDSFISISSGGGIFTTSNTAKYFKFYFKDTSYKNNICINISDATNGAYTQHKIKLDTKNANIIAYASDLLLIYDDESKRSYNTNVLKNFIDSNSDGVSIYFDNSKTLFIDNLNIITHNVRIIGGNFNGTFTLGDGTADGDARCYNIRFENMLIDNVDYSRNGIVFNSVEWVTITNCVITNCNYALATNSSSLSSQILRRGLIKGCRLKGLNHAVRFGINDNTRYSCGDINITDCHLWIGVRDNRGFDTPEHSFSVYATRPDGLTISNCTSFMSGIFLDSPYWSHIQGCNIFECASRGIFINNPYNLVIANNNIGWCGEQWQDVGQGIFMYNTNMGAPSCVIENNNITLTTGAGIKLIGIRYANISNNHLFECGGTDDSRYYGDNFVKRYEAFIVADSTSEGNVFVNNKMRSNKYSDEVMKFVDANILKNVFNDEQINPLDQMLISNGTKNKLPNNIVSETQNGVTITHQADDGILINGKSTAKIYSLIFESTEIQKGKFVFGKTYKFFVNKSDIAPVAMRVACVRNDTEIILKDDIYSHDFAEIPSDANKIKIYLHIPNDVTIDNVIVHPMATDSYVTSNTFAKYVD